MVTSRKRWSTNSASGQPQGVSWWSKSREEPDAHKQRHPINQDQIEFLGKTGSTQFLEQGSEPCSFFMWRSFFAMTASSNPIERSFELASERCDDLTPLVYARLFEQHPEARAMFRSEGAATVQGSMLSLTIEALLDFAGERSGRFRLIECEVSSHDAYGTPRDLFAAFFGVIRDTLRELLGSDWSDGIDAAWHKLLHDVDSVVSQHAT